MREIREWWLPIAQGLSSGSRVRVRHPLDSYKKSTSVLVWNSPEAYGVKCFRRGASDYVRKSYVNLQEAAELTPVQHGDPVPKDLQEFNLQEHHPLNEAAAKFLLQRGVDPERISRKGTPLGLYLSQQQRRLIFKGKDVLGREVWMGRDLTGRSPVKAVNYEGLGEGYYLDHDIDSTTVVLVEDVLSAFKVWDAMTSTLYPYEVVSLNGLQFRPSLLRYLLSKQRVVIWLDGDSAGIRGSIKLLQEVRALGIKAALVSLDGDPKDYSRKDILTVWEKARSGNHITDLERW